MLQGFAPHPTHSSPKSLDEPEISTRSATAFLEWTSADDPEVRARAMAAHAASIRSHIRDLAGKRYQDV